MDDSYLPQEQDDVPDIMNDPEFAPLPRRDTASSKYGSEGGLGQETCRICRSEGTPDEPLFYPCKCSGSIKFVHQECLMEWLSHSHKKHCELCKTPFRFTKLYDANMPKTLPWTVFIRRAIVHCAWSVVRVGRAITVAMVWLIALPWMIRWAWRWMFWFADAGWAREAFVRKMQASQIASHTSAQTTNAGLLNLNFSIPDAVFSTFEHLWESQFGSGESSRDVKTLEAITEALTNAFSNATSTGSLANSTFWPQADKTVLSSWTYVSKLTTHNGVNRFILDVFEGQLITCVVITGFILVFLIREWVVQQREWVAPWANLDNQNNARERERQERELRERLQRQTELLDQARERLAVLQEEGRAALRADQGGIDTGNSFQGREALSTLIDDASRHLPEDMNSIDDAALETFTAGAIAVLRQIRAAEDAGVNVAELNDTIYDNLASLSTEQRLAWREVLVSHLKDMVPESQSDSHLTQAPSSQTQPMHDEHLDLHTNTGNARRPSMPNRDSSSRATHIQRIIEEADSALSRSDRRSARSAAAESINESASAASAPRDGEDAQNVKLEEGVADVIDRTDIMPEKNDELPITNAGPDAKINIKRIGRCKGKAIIPEPEQPGSEVIMTTSELALKLADTEGEGSELSATDSVGAIAQNDLHEQSAGTDKSSSAATKARATDMQQADHQSVQNRPLDMSHESTVANEEPGVDRSSQSPTTALDGVAIQDTESSSSVQGQQPRPRPAALRTLADWFWGDIVPPSAPEPAPAPNEELIGEGDIVQAAPFVPVQDGQPAVPQAPNDDELGQAHDADVVAAAHQAGLDADAIDDAEDLEGIFELIGLHGPIIGLFQTSCFCSVLVTGTVLAAVGLPYVWGKLVLSFIGAPFTFLVKAPLQIASFIADLVIDITLMVTGWSTVILALLLDTLLAAAEAWVPVLAKYNIASWISDVASSTASAAGSRLSKLFFTLEPAAEDGLGWDWAFLSASVHAHASLKTLQSEIDAVLDAIVDAITGLVNASLAGTISRYWQQAMASLGRIPAIPTKLLQSLALLQEYSKPLLDVLGSLRSGALTFESSRTHVDPSLVYWSNTDRGLAVLAGYLALAVIAAVYVTIDKPITRSHSGQKTEKMIRNSLRQAGGVLKVILIISIEMLVFPLYCGLLLDLAFLPLFQSASIATRWAFALRAPYTFCFVHWFVGTCYMFHFALFVGMCRKILRRGVLWFIRDPDDPTFHPVRDVLERNVATQLRKIAFSALVYGALVILCLGGVIWSIGKVCNGIFPIHWTSTEPVLEFPLDLLLFNFLTPLHIRLFRPSDALNAMYAWWLRLCARVLRLSHFLFDDRRKEEEGRHVHKSWSSFLSSRKGDPQDDILPSDSQVQEGIELPEVYFRKDGKYVLTPCNDQYRPPKAGEAFLHVEDEDVYVADKDGKKNEHFAKVYIPPFFRLRVTMFMVCLWMFSAFTGLCATLLPLVFGRQILKLMLPQGIQLNDIYAYSLGAYIISYALFVTFKCRAGINAVHQKTQDIDIKAWIEVTRYYGTRALKCAYVYGFLGVVLPLVVAVLLHFYFIMPLHTYVAATVRPALEAAAKNETAPSSTSQFNAAEHFIAASEQLEDDLKRSAQWPNLADHCIHLLADYVLALLYLRIALRFIASEPSSKAYEAFRRITADGVLNPNVRLATRFFILPATLVAILMLFAPLGLAQLALIAIDIVSYYLNLAIKLETTARTLIYRYSYPLAAGCVCLVVGISELGRATTRWRARIRDEVYLVGERLHNFGEKKPPTGSKSVVRKER